MTDRTEPDVEADPLIALQRKVDALSEDLERKNRLLERAEMKELLDIERLRLTEQVQGDVVKWMRARIWWVVIIVSLVSIFGVRFVIEATANKQVFDQILSSTTSVVNDLNTLKAEAEAEKIVLEERRAAFEEKIDRIESVADDVLKLKGLEERVTQLEKAGGLSVPDLNAKLTTQQEWDNAIADWVFWTKIEVANDRANLLANLRERNPGLNWPPDVRTFDEMRRLRDAKVIVYITRRPYQTYDERLKRADDTRDRFIQYGYFSETYVVGQRDRRDENGVEVTVAQDLETIAQDIGTASAETRQKCISSCLIVDEGAYAQDPTLPARIGEIQTEVLAGTLANKAPTLVQTDLNLIDRIARVRDYTKAFPSTRRVDDEHVIVLVLGSLQ